MSYQKKHTKKQQLIFQSVRAGLSTHTFCIQYQLTQKHIPHVYKTTNWATPIYHACRQNELKSLYINADKNPHRYDKSVFILKDKRNPRRVLNTAYGSDSIVICTWFKHLILQDCFFLYLQMTMMFAKSLLMCVSNFDICSYSLKPY